MFRLIILLLSLLILFLNYGCAGIDSSTAQEKNSAKAVDFITYSSKNDPRALGLNFEMEYPAVWNSRTHKEKSSGIVRIFSKYPDNPQHPAAAIFTVGIIKLSDDRMQNYDYKKFFSKEYAQDCISETAKILDFQIIKLKDGNAWLVEYLNYDKAPDGEETYSRNIDCSFIYKNFIIRISAGTGSDSQSNSNDYFLECKPIFMRMINSLKFLDNSEAVESSVNNQKKLNSTD